MANQTIIKRSPIVLIRNFVGVELLAFLAYWLVTGHGSFKSAIYNQTFFANLLSYDTARLLFLSGVQLLITIYVFFHWYYESYVLKSGQLNHNWGVFLKKKKNFLLEKPVTINITPGFLLGKSLHYGSINLTNRHQSVFFLKTISRPEDYLKTIQKSIDPNVQRFAQKPDLPQLIDQEESENLEFKSSLRFDQKMNQLNRDLEKAVMKTVAAFLNSKGGYIVVGLDDKREPLGLINDYSTLQRKDSDGFENHFTQVFNAMIGPEFRQMVKIWFQDMGGKDVCIIQVAPSTRPAYLKINDNEHFFIRTGNTTTNLKFSEVESYSRTRWPRRNQS